MAWVLGQLDLIQACTKSYCVSPFRNFCKLQAKKRKTEDKIASDEAATKKSKLADGAVDSPKVTPAIAGSVEKGEVQKAQEEKKISQAGNVRICLCKRSAMARTVLSNVMALT